MAETASVVSLVASIDALNSLGTNVAARIDEFSSLSSEVPQLFSILSARFPLLTSSLHAVRKQTQAGCLSCDATIALRALISRTTNYVSIIGAGLGKVSPPNDVSRAQRSLEGLKNLGKDKDFETAAAKLHESIDSLLHFHTNQHVDASTHNLEKEVAQLHLVSHVHPAHQSGSQYRNITAQDYSTVHLGDIYNVHYPNTVEFRPLGLCLASAPLIKPDDFVGRATETDTIFNILRPEDPSNEQQRIVLGGLGGVGKTQLAIGYARRYQRHYTSVLWLNATSEATLHASFQSFTCAFIAAEELEKLTKEQVLTRAHQWLSRVHNTKWLIVFDNYDEPDQFDIDSFCPNIGHGSVIITTRLPDQVTGQQVRVHPLKTIDDSLSILQARSGREYVKHDHSARNLVQRLGGLPLALVTAGSYLRRSTITFQQYLDTYEQRWQVDPRRPPRLQDYQGRTLYTTWNMSYSRLKDSDTTAARTLKLLAYFDNQEIWYDLVRAGLSTGSPPWLKMALDDRINFESVMGTLVDYCLVDIQHATQSYSLHSCVHDWLLGDLNEEIDSQLYWYAFECVSNNIDKNDVHALVKAQYARLSRHGIRLTHHRFERCTWVDSRTSQHLLDATWVGEMLSAQGQLSAAEWICLRAKAESEKLLGLGNPLIFKILAYLGNIYCDQNKLTEAESMFQQALAGNEKLFGLEHEETLSSVYNLGRLYHSQGRQAMAEQMFRRVLAGDEKILGTENAKRLRAMNMIGVLSMDQGKLEDAEQMLKRALAGEEKVIGVTDLSTLLTLLNLGRLYRRRGKLDESERLLQQALAGFTEFLSPRHQLILTTLVCLGTTYYDHSQLDKAEEVFQWALSAFEKVSVCEKEWFHHVVEFLGKIYRQQGRVAEAEQMEKRLQNLMNEQQLPR